MAYYYTLETQIRRHMTSHTPWVLTASTLCFVFRLAALIIDEECPLLHTVLYMSTNVTVSYLPLLLISEGRSLISRDTVKVPVNAYSKSAGICIPLCSLTPDLSM